MKTAINTQSQNEVKDLLNEYVVSPLNTDISTTLSKMSKEIESLEESTKADIGKISPSVNDNISRLRRLLDLSFHFDEEEDAFENLSDKIENSQEIITDKIDQSNKELSDIISGIETVIAQLKTDFKEVDKRINDTTKKNNQELKTSISKPLSTLEELFKEFQTASNSSTNQIKSELSNMQTSVTNKLSDLSKLIIESFKQAKKQSSDIQSSLTDKLQEIENLITENSDGLTENLNTQLQTVSDNYTEQSTAISNYHEDAKTVINSMGSQQQSLIEQKYKTLFAVSLSFGIVNALGVIAMIVLFLIK